MNARTANGIPIRMIPPMIVSQPTGFCSISTHIAVSYTHLDVYKRQGLESAPYPQRAELERLHAAAFAVKAGDVAAGLSGPAVGEAMRKARVQAIAQARGKG